jgi:P27 family predicted phage terminase small subunit
LLDAMGVLTEADGPALAALAETADDLVVARRALAAHGGSLTYATETGVRVWPEVRIVAEANKRLASWLARFGMTPSDRSKVSVVERKDHDPLDELFT